MKINRLFEITTILLNRDTVTAKELAERFGVSTRTIYRDIDILSSAGIPIYMNKGNGGGISLLENYAMSRMLISGEESESLLMAIKTMQATQIPDLDIVLEKMGAIFKNSPSHDWVEVDFSNWGSIQNDKNKFIDIKKAMLQRKVICFDYVNSEGQKSRRLAEPQKLVFKCNAWYLIAYCRQRHEFRTFRISRLKNLEVIEEFFEPKRLVGNLKEDINELSQSLVHLKMRFHRQALSRLYDYFDDSYIVSNDDGSITIEVDFPEGEWIYSYILSFGYFVEVLEPEHIRKTIAERMKKALEFYKTCF